MSRLVSVDGRIVAETEARVSAFDRGFTLADGVFETLRIYDGKPFRLDLHLERLRGAAGALHIPFPAGVENSVRELLDRGHGRTGSQALRITLTRGVSGEGSGLGPEDSTPALVISLSDLHLFGGIYDEGIAAIVATGRRNEFSSTAGLKTLSYTDSVFALMEARRAGADDALLLDTRGHVAEGASSNIILTVGNELLTPPISCGAIPGITLRTVSELADGLGLRMTTREIEARELESADEIILCSSLREIAPVVRLGPRQIGTGRPGPHFRRILRAYCDYAAS